MSPAARLSAESRKDEILSAVVRLFGERGFNGVTTKELADAAGVSEALLYKHFSSKRGLYEALQERCIAHATQDIDRLNSLPDDTATFVIAVYVLMFRVRGNERHEIDANLSPLMYRSLLAEGTFARGFMKCTSQPWIEKMRRCADAALDTGDLVCKEAKDRPHATDIVETLVWFAHHVIVASKLMDMPKEPVVPYSIDDPEDRFELSVQFALRGIGLTPDAIERYYQPKHFRLLMESDIGG